MPQEYLEKFSKLPKSARERLGSETTVKELKALEKQYFGIHFASLLIKMAVGDIKNHDIDIALEERGVDEKNIQTVRKKLEAFIVSAGIKVLAKKQEAPRVPYGTLEEQYKAFLGSENFSMITDHKLSTKDKPTGQVVTGYDEIKSQFYEAISTQDKILFLATLIRFFQSGRLKELFKTDERYIKFWRPRVLKAGGLERTRVFDENPAKLVFFGSFIKYVLKHRFSLIEDESVLWGVYLSGLAHEAGDKEYEQLAYGDMNTQKFRWNF